MRCFHFQFKSGWALGSWYFVLSKITENQLDIYFSGQGEGLVVGGGRGGAAGMINTKANSDLPAGAGA